ncbi:hypothetical protein [Paraherbaspirillum soli]|uniref:Holin n=1 Tax=Paraherbaspirillum soli TaxID=631222 RepID=A0ABW0MFI8_9BURK
MQQDTDNKAFFSKVETHFQALDLIRVTTKALYIIAALQLVTALLTGGTGLVDCVVNAVCAYCIRRFHSRIAAAVALLLAVATPIVALSRQGGASSIAIVFSLLAIWAGGRALEVTLKLHGRLALTQTKNRDDVA